MNTTPLNTLAYRALAECAAEVFARWHTARHRDADSARALLRARAVAGLRWLWRRGDPLERSILAVNVRTWHDDGPDSIGMGVFSQRILERESRRTREADLAAQIKAAAA